MAPSSRRLAAVARHLSSSMAIESAPSAANVETAAPELVLGELPDRPPVAEMDPNLSVKAGHSEETLTELRMAALEEHGFVSLFP